MRCFYPGMELMKGEDGALMPSWGTGPELRQAAWSAGLPLLGIAAGWLFPPTAALAPRWLLALAGAYHRMERQRKRRRRVGQRRSSIAEVWPLPSVSSFCRLAWSTCQDGQGSGPGPPEELLSASPPTQGSPLGPGTWVQGLGAEPSQVSWEILGGLTSILSLAPSSCFPLIRATLCRAFRVRSSLPEEEYQRADSMKNLAAGAGVGVGFRLQFRSAGLWAGGGLSRALQWDFI